MSAVVAYVPSFAAEETHGVCRACRVSWCWWLVAARLTADGLPSTSVIISLIAARLTADGLPVVGVITSLVAARLTADGLPVAGVITSLAARLTADGLHTVTSVSRTLVYLTVNDYTYTKTLRKCQCANQQSWI